jgi:acyl carrier protein
LKFEVWDLEFGISIINFLKFRKVILYLRMDKGIIESINTLLIEEFEVDPGQITPEADLKTTLDLDSLDYIDLIAITAANFGCKVKPEDFNDIKTFGEFYSYIIAHARQRELI